VFGDEPLQRHVACRVAVARKRCAGDARRRMRRLILRDFNNVRTAIRNGDLAIRDFHPRPGSSYRISGFGPVRGGHKGGPFLVAPVVAP
jgi:hypothetical protein